jgi:hypothetical protein
VSRLNRQGGFPNNVVEEITILPIVKNGNTTVLPHGRIVHCKKPLLHSHLSSLQTFFFQVSVGVPDL